MLVRFIAYPSGDSIAICPHSVVAVEQLRHEGKRVALIILASKVQYVVRDRGRSAIDRINRAIVGETNDRQGDEWEGN